MQLRSFIGKIPRALYGRVARNIYFWVLLLNSKIVRTETLIPAPRYYALVWLNILFFVLPCTVNNFVLVPRLLRRKRYGWYLAVFVVMVFCFAFMYTLWLKYLLVLYPGMEIFDVSTVAPPLIPDLGIASVLDDMSSIFYIMLVLGCAFTGVWYFNDYSRNEKIAGEAVKRQMETELNFLKSQLNPHFLFNTLNNLYGLSLRKSDETPEAILKLSTVLRYILYESNVELIAFEKEKEIMQAYIDIEMLRYPETANVQFSISSARPRHIPPLLWLPVLENVFKHGAGTLNDNYLVDFRFSLDDHGINIYSRNTYEQGRSKAGRPGGIGLSNLRKRLAILYPGLHSITTGADDDNFYSVNVQIAWHEQKH